MTQDTQPEANYLEAVVRPILGWPDKLVIDQITDERGILLTITIAQEDMGKIIGKLGETAKAIRRLIRQYGMLNDKHIAIKINEPK